MVPIPNTVRTAQGSGETEAVSNTPFVGSPAPTPFSKTFGSISAISVVLFGDAPVAVPMLPQDASLPWCLHFEPGVGAVSEAQNWTGHHGGIALLTLRRLTAYFDVRHHPSACALVIAFTLVS